jgi:hypothetical protein
MVIQIPGFNNTGHEWEIRMVRLIILAWMLTIPSFGQKQLVFLRHGTVVARYFEGSHMKCVLKDGRERDGEIRGLTEFSMITSTDTIPFQSIAKMDIKSQHHINVQNGIGGLLFLGGIVYLAADGFNKALGYNSGGWDQGDSYALVITGVGAAMVFVKPRYLRVSDAVIMRTVDKDSQYYLRVE